MSISAAASLRVGAEFEMSDPFSIRLDGFVLWPLGRRGVRPEWATDDLTAGAALMGVWAFD
jgi:hypothetical protein